jgi:hypothetical protein
MQKAECRMMNAEYKRQNDEDGKQKATLTRGYLNSAFFILPSAFPRP